MEKKTRIIIGVILFAIILGVVGYMFINKEGVFAKYTTLHYPDGCKEEFKNGVAITKLCTRGRLLSEGQIDAIKSTFTNTS